MGSDLHHFSSEGSPQKLVPSTKGERRFNNSQTFYLSQVNIAFIYLLIVFNLHMLHNH